MADLSAKNKEVRALIKEVLRTHPDHQVVLSKASHWKIIGPKGEFVVALPLTPGGGRSMQNTKALLKRKGLLGNREGVAH